MGYYLQLAVVLYLCRHCTFNLTAFEFDSPSEWRNPPDIQQRLYHNVNELMGKICTVLQNYDLLLTMSFHLVPAENPM